jgi:AcrR family transcriptional regulator
VAQNTTRSPARASATRTSAAPASTDETVDADAEQRTRGGWIPVGTAAERRAIHSERGTARGERTRRQIVDAARVVFERDGYLNVGVADIAKEANVAHGSFYTYFPSKLDVFRVLCAEVSAAVDESVRRRDAEDRTHDPVEALKRANLRYIETYQQNARIYAMMNQLGHIDEQLTLMDGGRRQQHFKRVADQIRRWQARGIADPAVDPAPTAAALVLAITNLCYWMFDTYDGDEPLDVPRYANTINDVWIRAVDLRSRPNRRWLAAAKATEQAPAE